MNQTLCERMDQIYAEHFPIPVGTEQKNICPYFAHCCESLISNKCSKNEMERLINSEHSFFANHNAHIGENYGKWDIPKIVFIGKENTSPTSKTKKTADFRCQNNQHYRRTRAVLAALLGLTSSIDEYGGVFELQPEGSSGLVGLHTVFALTNHYHCAFKKSEKVHGLPATNVMWYHCAEIVKSELELLQPDIVVIQAAWSVKKGAEQDIQNYFGEENLVVPDHDTDGLFWCVRKKDGARICCIIGSYHPAFHCWNREEYIRPLNRRVSAAAAWYRQRG